MRDGTTRAHIVRRLVIPMSFPGVSMRPRVCLVWPVLRHETLLAHNIRTAACGLNPLIRTSFLGISERDSDRPASQATVPERLEPHQSSRLQRGEKHVYNGFFKCHS